MPSGLMRGILITLAVFGLSGTAASAGNDDQSAYYYFYFQQPIPLTLETDAVAVFVGDDARIATLPDVLAQYGIAAGDIAPISALGWVHAAVPAARRSPAGVRALVAELAADPAVEFVSPVFTAAGGLTQRMTPDLLIGFQAEIEPAEAEALLADLSGGTIAEREFGGLPNTYRVRSASKNGLDVLERANLLAGLPQVEFAEPDKLGTVINAYTPNDTYFGDLWGIKNTGQSGGTSDMDIDGDQAWDISKGDEAIIIVILDEGVEQDHPDINQTPGKDFTGRNVTGGGPYNKCDNHGTAVAGCATATIDNKKGVVGVSPLCLTSSAKISEASLNCDGSGTSQDSWLVNGLNWSHQTKKARITNSSFKRSPSSSVTNAYKSARDKGVIHFAATGNDSDNQIAYPSSLETVNAVGALNRNGNRASFSNYGDGIDFSAPGVDIRTTDRTGSDGYDNTDYVWLDGTSMASPYAAGVGALILSVKSDFAPTQVEEIMQKGCVDRGSKGYDTTYGWGFVNAYNSLKQPGSFTLKLPADGDTDVSRNPFFSWSSSQNAETYTLTIDDDPNFSSPFVVITDIKTTGYTLTGDPLAEFRTYYWKIVAVRYNQWTKESTPASASFTTIHDCNDNGVDDATDIANGTSEDCNANGRPDECDLISTFLDASPQLSPIGSGAPQAFKLLSPPDAAGDVTLSFQAVGDFNLTIEYVDVDINGVSVGRVFEAGGNDCPSTPDEEQLSVPAATFNDARGAGDAVINMVASANVNKDLCTPPSWIAVTVQYASVPVSQDENHNGIPDECEGPPPGVTVTESGGSTAVTEGGATDAYTVVLNRAPAADVVITLAFDATQLSPTPTKLTFTTGNWATPQTVTVAAVDDKIVEGTQILPITHSAASGDPNYNGITIASVNVQITDNDPQYPVGDVNCDGEVTFDDIDPFTLALTGQASYEQQYPNCNYWLADINGDGSVDFDDIDPFVELLTK